MSTKHRACGPVCRCISLCSERCRELVFSSVVLTGGIVAFFILIHAFVRFVQLKIQIRLFPPGNTCGDADAMFFRVVAYASDSVEKGLFVFFSVDDKKFIPAPPTDTTCACNDCAYMKLITLPKIISTLTSLNNEITLSDEVIASAKKPILRMLEIK